jgi:hypothetical protein
MCCSKQLAQFKDLVYYEELKLQCRKSWRHFIEVILESAEVVIWTSPSVVIINIFHFRQNEAYNLQNQNLLLTFTISINEHEV